MQMWLSGLGCLRDPHSLPAKTCMNHWWCVESYLPNVAPMLPSYGDCLEVKREYYQNSSVLNCVTQCSQSTAQLYHEQLLQVQQIGFVTLGPLRCA